MLRDRPVQCAAVSGLVLVICIALNPALWWLMLAWAIVAGAAVGQARNRNR